MNHFTIHKYREYSYLRAYKAPLQLSRILYKSTLFMQNEPKFRKSQMNVNNVLAKDYEQIDTWSIGKNEPKTNPNKPNLQNPQMNVNSILTKDYENNPALWLRQNKPKTNPISEKLKMNVRSALTKDYESQPLRRLPENKPNQTRAGITPNALNRLVVTL